MPKYGKLSLANYAELDPKLQRVLSIVIQYWDHTITDAGRTVDEQRQNVAKGVSKTMNSKHLLDEDGNANAMDVQPYPINWPAIQKGYDAIKRLTGGMEVLEFYAFAGFVDGVAAALGINLRSGYDWNTNRQFEDQTFLDLPHYELR